VGTAGCWAQPFAGHSRALIHRVTGETDVGIALAQEELGYGITGIAFSA
jgi:hypothetical protein